MTAGCARKVVVVGSYNQDHVWRLARFPDAGETVRGHDFAIGAGGKGFNQAVASVRQGATTAFIGARGDDSLGELAARTASDVGLDCRWQIRADRATGSAAILVDDEGQNEIVVALGANEHLSAAFIAEQEAVLAEAGVLLAQMETTLEAVRAALEAGRRHGLTCMLNPAPVHAGIDAELLELCDILTPNEHEFAQLLRQLGVTDIEAGDAADMPEDALHDLCRRLQVPTVIVTLGRHGCFVSHADNAPHRHDDDVCYRVAAETVKVLDTTGAGDAFNGALAAVLARAPDTPFRQAVQHAGRAAALSTERAGAAASMVDLDTVLTRFTPRRGRD